MKAGDLCQAEHHPADAGRTMYACVLERGHAGQHRDMLGRLWGVLEVNQ